MNVTKNVMAALLVAAISFPLMAETTPEPAADPILAADGSGSASGDEAGSDKLKFTADFGGRLMLDYAWFDDDRDDGGEVRRGRLYAKGKIGDNWDYKIQFEFSGDSPELRDGYLRYKGLGPGTLWLGNYKQPTSLEVLGSSKYTTFMEAGLATAQAEGRRMGVGYQLHGDHYVAMASLFGDEANGEAEGTGIVGRGVWIPINTGNHVVHLGGSISRQEPQNGVARIRVRPESHVTDDRILDTGTITGVDNVLRPGIESAVVWDRFSAQAEWVQGDLSRSGGNPDLTFDGWYAYGSFFLTPDRRNYVGKEGVFDKVKPTGKGGAWEVALRYSTLDLTDQDVLGGSGDAVTVGLNWYPNEYLRFMANYTAVDTDEVAGNDDPNVIQVRMQIAF